MNATTLALMDAGIAMKVAAIWEFLQTASILTGLCVRRDCWEH